MSRAALTLTQTFSFCILFFFSPAKTKHYQHLVMVHNTKAAAPSSAQVLCGAAQAENDGPKNVQRAVEVHSHSLGKELVVFADLCPSMSWWVSPGVRHRRSDRTMDSLVCCFRLLLVLKGSIRLLVSAKSPGTNSPWNRMSAQKRTSSQACHSSRERYVWIVGLFEVFYEERKKTYTKNQPRAVLSQFSLLETPSFPRVQLNCSF